VYLVVHAGLHHLVLVVMCVVSCVSFLPFIIHDDDGDDSTKLVYRQKHL
jgi:hypothetical protein